MSRSAFPPPARPSRPRAVAALVALLAVGCGPRAEEPPAAAAAPAVPPNALVFVVDALRDDAVDCAAHRERTPALCGLADRGTRFTSAYAAAPWTLPASVALLTGVYPGVYAVPGTADIQHLYRVPQAESLWVERLVERGYRARAYVENGVALRGRAFQGFDVVRFGRKRQDRLLAALGEETIVRPRDGRYRHLLWLHEELAGLAAPAADPAPFLFLHWIDDPHAPYAPPWELSPSPEGLPREASFYRNLGHHHRPHRGVHNLRRVLDELSPAELAHVRELYLSEVRSVDERLGAALAALERSGRADSTYVVVTADHGEGFGEHGEYLHGVTLYDELVRVPWIVAGPGVPAGETVTAPISHVDLVPTLAAWLGVPAPGGVHGESLTAWLGGGSAERRLPVYLSSPDRLEQEGVVTEDYKLVVAPDGRRLIARGADPEERRDVAARETAVAAELTSALRRVRRAIDERRAAVAADSPALSEAERRETEQQLRAVGYVQ